MMDVRRHLEELAFALAASRIDKEVEAKLRAHLRKMKELVAKKDHFGVAEEDFSFHKTVWKASGNEVPAKTLEAPLYLRVRICQFEATCCWRCDELRGSVTVYVAERAAHA
jgi:DNA-binding GntR family transcriptional regulator